MERCPSAKPRDEYRASGANMVPSDMWCPHTMTSGSRRPARIRRRCRERPYGALAASGVLEVEVGRFQPALDDQAVDGRARHAHPCENGRRRGVPADVAARLPLVFGSALLSDGRLVNLVRVPLGLRQDSERRQRQQRHSDGECRDGLSFSHILPRSQGPWASARAPSSVVDAMPLLFWLLVSCFGRLILACVVRPVLCGGGDARALLVAEAHPHSLGHRRIALDSEAPRDELEPLVGIAAQLGHGVGAVGTPRHSAIRE